MNDKFFFFCNKLLFKKIKAANIITLIKPLTHNCLGVPYCFVFFLTKIEQKLKIFLFQKVRFVWKSPPPQFFCVFDFCEIFVDIFHKNNFCLLFVGISFQIVFCATFVNNFTTKKTFCFVFVEISVFNCFYDGFRGYSAQKYLHEIFHFNFFCLRGFRRICRPKIY
jgi:hypothetical protein